MEVKFESSALEGSWRAASAPERVIQCLLFESLLGDGLKEGKDTACLGRSDSKGWLRAHSEPGSVRCFWGFKDVREEGPAGP